MLKEVGLQTLQPVINQKADPNKTRKRSVGRTVHNNDKGNNDYNYDYKLIFYFFLEFK